MYTTIIIAVVALALGVGIGWTMLRLIMKHRAQNIIKEAEAEAEVLKKDKMLQAKEKFLQMKTEHEKQVAARNSKIQQAENKLKQQETEISRKLEDIQRKTKDIQNQQGNIDVQKELLEKKTAELDKLKKQQIEQLEAISGMSGEQAKEKLINSLKEEAEAEAISYVNEIMEEAKMTANMEAKKVVIKTIQRVATETAKSKGASSDAKDATSAPWRLPPAWKSSWTTPPKPLYFQALTPSAGKSHACRSTNWLRTDVSTPHASKRLSTK